MLLASDSIVSHLENFWFDCFLCCTGLKEENVRILQGNLGVIGFLRIWLKLIPFVLDEICRKFSRERKVFDICLVCKKRLKIRD